MLVRSTAETAALEAERTDGGYLTDGAFLYRVVAVDTAGTVELEDCYGLDVVRVSVTAVRERRLRGVEPAP